MPHMEAVCSRIEPCVDRFSPLTEDFGKVLLVCRLVNQASPCEVGVNIGHGTGRYAAVASCFGERFVVIERAEANNSLVESAGKRGCTGVSERLGCCA